MGGGGRGTRERGGGDALPSPASSSARDPWSQTSEMLHAVKLVDKNMHWEDKGLEVRVQYCGAHFTQAFTMRL